MILNKAQVDKIELIKINDDLTLKPGDRIYVSPHVKSLKKRQLDKYLKSEFTDVKRVSKVSSATIVVDTCGYGDKPNLIDAVHGYIINNEKHVKYTYDYRSQLTDLIDEMVPKGMRDVCYSKNYWGERYHYPDDNYLINNYPDILKRSNIGNHTNKIDEVEFKYLIDNLNDYKFYKHTTIESKVSEFMDNNRESTENIDIDTITSLFKSSDDANAKLAVSMISAFDMRNHHVELLLTFYNKKCQGKSQIILKKYLNKNPTFKNLVLPNCGLSSSNIDDSGFYSLKRNLKEMSKLGYEIDYLKITKMIFDE